MDNESERRDVRGLGPVRISATDATRRGGAGRSESRGDKCESNKRSRCRGRGCAVQGGGRSRAREAEGDTISIDTNFAVDLHKTNDSQTDSPALPPPKPLESEQGRGRRDARGGGEIN